MHKNMGLADRILRILAGLVVVWLYWTGQISGVWATVLGLLAIAFLMTGMAGSCPAYYPFGFTTKSRSADR